MKMYCERVFAALVLILTENDIVSGQGLLQKQDTYGPEVYFQPASQHAGHAPAPPPHPPNYVGRNNYHIYIDPKILEAAFGSSSARHIDQAPQQQVEKRPRGAVNSTSLKDQEAFEIEDRLFSRNMILLKFNENRQVGKKQKPEQSDVLFTNIIEPHDFQEHEMKSIDKNHLTESEQSYVGIIEDKSNPRKHTPHIPEDTNDRDDADSHISGLNPAIIRLSGFLEPTGRVNKDQGNAGPKTEEFEVRNFTVSKLDTKNASSRNLASFSFFIAIIILFVM